MVVAVARVQAPAFQQSIRKARETEERARTAQAVLRSFEESGSNWLWESDASGCLAYVSPQFGELLGQVHQSLVGTKLVDLFRPHMGARYHKSSLPILEFTLSARLFLRAWYLPVRLDCNQRWLSL